MYIWSRAVPLTLERLAIIVDCIGLSIGGVGLTPAFVAAAFTSAVLLVWSETIIVAKLRILGLVEFITSLLESISYLSPAPAFMT